MRADNVETSSQWPSARWRHLTASSCLLSRQWETYRTDPATGHVASRTSRVFGVRRADHTFVVVFFKWKEGKQVIRVLSSVSADPLPLPTRTHIHIHIHSLLVQQIFRDIPNRLSPFRSLWFQYFVLVSVRFLSLRFLRCGQCTHTQTQTEAHSTYVHKHKIHGCKEL